MADLHFNVKDITGKTFERLTVVGTAPRKNGKFRWLCRCTCGAEVPVVTSNLTRGISKSCGCLNKEKKFKHGHTAYRKRSTGTYTSWDCMMRRCYNKKNARYSCYGGRGITVCDRWHDFRNFLADMGEKPKGTSLDRKDNNGNYEPGNCRWATPKEQNNNQRRNKLITFNGETHTLEEWSRILNIKYPTLSGRLNRNGWSVEQAFTTQPKDGPISLTYQGTTRALVQWAKLFNINYNVISQRLKSGWPIEQALTMPARKLTRKRSRPEALPPA